MATWCRSTILGLLIASSSLTAAVALQDPTERDRRDLPNHSVALTLKGVGLGPALKQLSSPHDQLDAVPHLLDRRVTIACTDRSASSIMEGLSALWSTRRYPAFWRKRGSGKWELWQDSRAVNLLDELVDQDRKRISRSLARLAAMNGSEEPVDAEAQRDPVLQTLLRPADWRNLNRPISQMFGTFPRPVFDSVVSGRGFWTPFGALPPQVQSGLLSGSLGMERRGRRLPDGSVAGESSQDARTRILASNLSVNVQVDPSSGRWNLELSLTDPDRRATTSYGVQIGQLGLSEASSDWTVKPETTLTTVGARPDAELTSSEPAEPRPWKEFADFQLFVARRSGLSVVSDYHSEKAPPNWKRVVDAASLSKILALATRDPHTYLMKPQRTGVLLFKNRLAPLDDLREIPAGLESRLTDRLRKHGYLDLEHILALVSLNEAQLARVTKKLPWAVGLRSRLRPLRWFGRLDASQRIAAAGPSGLRVSSTSRAAQAELFLPGGAVDPMIAQIGDVRSVIIAIHEEVLPGEAVIHIRLQSPSGSRAEFPFKQPIRLLPVDQGLGAATP